MFWAFAGRTAPVTSSAMDRAIKTLYFAAHKVVSKKTPHNPGYQFNPMEKYSISSGVWATAESPAARNTDRSATEQPSLLQIEVPQRPLCQRTLLRLLHRFSELLGQHIVLVLLRIHTLRKNRLPPRIRLPQSLGRLAKVLEHLLLRSRRMRNHRPRHRIHLQDPPTIRTRHFKRLIAQTHGKTPRQHPF